MALLTAANDGEVSLADLALDQQQALASHPDATIRELAEKLLAKGGSLPSADRKRVLDDYIISTQQSGDAVRGKAIFTEQCSKCHMHGDIGVQIGPNLTGMAVHPKAELLTHILDPSRNVEGNFRAYSVLTADGMVLSGMLASESKTSIELFDTAGKRQSVLREDIDELIMSKNSIMPEGFEKSIPIHGMTDLLEFLTTKGQYLPLALDSVATAISTKPLFGGGDDGPDRMVFADWKLKTVHGIPFQLTDPLGKSKPNIILLHGPNGTLPPKMPNRVSLPCGTSAKAIHLLSGVGGWSYPFSMDKTVSMIIRLRYSDGQTEDHKLINGIHFADYIRRVDVPASEFAFALGDQQIRFLTVNPKLDQTIETIEFVKGDDASAPIVMAVTVEARNPNDH